METIADEISRLIESNKKELEGLEKVDASELTAQISDNGMLIILHNTLSDLRESRPDERGERSRHYAIAITEMEKVYAYFKSWIVDGVGTVK